jgi:hypothetical protein
MVLLLGTVRNGQLSGASFSEVIKMPNPEPQKCSEENGVTYLESTNAVITIERENLKITCWGKYKQTFEPGLTNN